MDIDCQLMDLGREILDKSLTIAALAVVVYLYEVRLRRRDNEDAQKWASVGTLANAVDGIVGQLEKLAERRNA